MKTMLLALMLLPSISFAQKWNYEGVYAMPEINDKKVRLKPWDTIREAFTFTLDSFKYSYAVMRPNGRVAVSVDYDEYGAWKICKDTTLSEPDKHSGQSFNFKRTYAVLDDGRISGYFELANAVDSNFSAGSNTPLSFIRNNKVFYYSRKPGHPLQR